MEIFARGLLAVQMRQAGHYTSVNVAALTRAKTSQQKNFNFFVKKMLCLTNISHFYCKLIIFFESLFLPVLAQICSES